MIFKKENGRYEGVVTKGKTVRFEDKQEMLERKFYGKYRGFTYYNRTAARRRKGRRGDPAGSDVG